MSPLLRVVDDGFCHGAASICNPIVGAARVFQELEAVPGELARD